MNAAAPAATSTLNSDGTATFNFGKVENGGTAGRALIDGQTAGARDYYELVFITYNGSIGGKDDYTAYTSTAKESEALRITVPTGKPYFMLMLAGNYQTKALLASGFGNAIADGSTPAGLAQGTLYFKDGSSPSGITISSTDSISVKFQLVHIVIDPDDSTPAFAVSDGATAYPIGRAGASGSQYQYADSSYNNYVMCAIPGAPISSGYGTPVSISLTNRGGSGTYSTSAWNAGAALGSKTLTVKVTVQGVLPLYEALAAISGTSFATMFGSDTAASPILEKMFAPAGQLVQYLTKDDSSNASFADQTTEAGSGSGYLSPGSPNTIFTGVTPTSNPSVSAKAGTFTVTYTCTTWPKTTGSYGIFKSWIPYQFNFGSNAVVHVNGTGGLGEFEIKPGLYYNQPDDATTSNGGLLLVIGNEPSKKLTTGAVISGGY
jgi:hypothetical protein